MLPIVYDSTPIEPSQFVSLSSWTIDLQSEGNFSTPECTLELYLPDVEPEQGDSVTIGDWSFVVEDVTQHSAVYTIHLKGTISTIEGRSCVINSPMAASSTYVATQLIGEGSGVPEGFLFTPNSLSFGRMIFKDPSVTEWDNWEIKVTGIGQDISYAAGSHSIFFSTSSIADLRDSSNPASFFPPLSVGLNFSWSIYNPYYSDTYTVEAEGIFPEKMKVMDRDFQTYFQIGAARGQVLYDVIKAVHPYELQQAGFDLIKPNPRSFSVDCTPSFHSGVTENAARWTSTLAFNYKGDEKSSYFWNFPWATTQLFFSTKTYYLRCATVSSRQQWTYADLSSFCHLHGGALVQDGNRVHFVSLTPSSTAAAPIIFTADQLVSVEPSSEQYAFHTPFTKCTAVSVDDDGGELSIDLSLSPSYKEGAEFSTSVLGSAFTAIPAVFTENHLESPTQIEPPYILLTGGIKTIYDPALYGKPYYFGNARGFFFGRMMPISNDYVYPDELHPYTHALDETGTYWPAAFETVIELPPYVDVEDVEHILNGGPFVCLQDVNPSASQSSSTQTGVYELSVPWRFGKDLRVGDVVSVDLISHWATKQTGFVVSVTYDWANNLVQFRCELSSTDTPATKINYKQIAATPARFPAFELASFPLAPVVFTGRVLRFLIPLDVQTTIFSASPERLSLQLVKDSTIYSFPCVSGQGNPSFLSEPYGGVNAIKISPSLGLYFSPASGTDLTTTFLADYLNADKSYKEGCLIQLVIDDTNTYDLPPLPTPPPTPTWHLISGTEVTPTKSSAQYYSCHQFEVNSSTRLSGTLDITKGLFVEINGEAFFSPAFEGSLKTVLSHENGFLRATTSSWTTSYPNNWGVGGVYLVNNRSRSVQEWYLTDEMYEKFNNDEVTIRVWYNAEAELY